MFTILRPPGMDATAAAQAQHAGMSDLTIQELARYHVDGFLARPALVPADELPRLTAIYDDLFARRAGRERGDQFDLFGDDSDPLRPQVPQILNPERYAPELTGMRFWTAARALLAQLFGREPAYLGSHAICKPAGSPLPTPWHQDEAYWDAGKDYCEASVWIPLQPVDEASGCMHFVPRSHLGDLLPHRHAGNDPRVHGLELDGAVADLAGAVACPLPAGGCTVHHHRLLHYAGANRAAVPRRALIVVGGLEPLARLRPKDLPWAAAARTARAERAAGAA
jgi:hypothetical protein